MVTSYRFLGGPIALHGWVHFLNTTEPSLTKVVYAGSNLGGAECPARIDGKQLSQCGAMEVHAFV
jgi:hypothetical protein